MKADRRPSNRGEKARGTRANPAQGTIKVPGWLYVEIRKASGLTGKSMQALVTPVLAKKFKRDLDKRK